MKTKAQIVQELLEAKHITAEDAVILLMDNEREYILSYPVYPAYPAPLYPTQPFITYCN